MTNLPQELIDALKPMPGFSEAAFRAVHAQGPGLTSIRRNPFKPARLAFEGEQVPWCADGYYLAERPSFTADPLFHAGCYYVQEAGSMFLDYALRQSCDFSQVLNVLDLCAAPGGKSTLLNSLLNRQSLLVANEVIKPRAEVLAYNLSKWGSNNSVVTNNDPEHFEALGEYFDLIVVDAPCSGSGLFRKQPKAVNEWSIDAVNLCSGRQKRILAHALEVLKPGGVLLYSTCSYSQEENEQIADWLIDTYELENIALPAIPSEWGIVDSSSAKHNARGYRFYPHLTRSEGFFCCLFRKPGQSPGVGRRKPKPAFETLPAKEAEALKAWVRVDEEDVWIRQKDNLRSVTRAVEAFLNLGHKQFYFRKAGVLLGAFAGRDFVPDHELALALCRQQDIPFLELDTELALKYLRKETFPVTSGKQGWHLVGYQGQGLGWAKVLPNRINNYLPKEFRIHSADFREV